MHRPRLLVLDEPTSGLDPLNQHEFGQMAAEVRAEGRTVFLSSHILSEVESLCDRVGIIRDGRLVRVGGVTELKDIKHHEVDLTFATVPPAAEFSQVAGVERVEVLPDGRTLRVTIQGDLDPLVKMAARTDSPTSSAASRAWKTCSCVSTRTMAGRRRRTRPVWFRSVFLKTLTTIASQSWAGGSGWDCSHRSTSPVFPACSAARLKRRPSCLH